ncbi:TetR/AcrR family transcriptional regulator [Rubritalea spongiae]|uniref:TetR/AcrR family transcriptional regulator n=1 Tax=Rubritalea spongiae TaxID=430797 RepID=A0ABW5E8T8_9BACT
MSTRDQILAAAWKLFSERGFEDVSVRDVTNEAGVNLASVSYHFGSKDGLIQEVVKKVLNPANQHRMDLLEAAIAEAGGTENLTLQSILESYARPIMFPEEHGSNQDILARLAARYMIERDYDVPNSVLALYTEVFQKYVTIISTKVTHLTPQEILQRLLFSIGAALQYETFASLARKTVGETGPVDKDKDFDEFVKFVLSGFSA